MSDTPGSKPVYKETLSELPENERVVILPNGVLLPIAALWDDNFNEVETIEEAYIVLCGSADLGWYELDVEGVARRVTFH